jgi:hypothetical protein
LEGVAIKNVGIVYGQLVYFIAKLVNFMAIWYILCSLDIFFPFWYVVPRKIWQPRDSVAKPRNTVASGEIDFSNAGKNNFFRAKKLPSSLCT